MTAAPAQTFFTPCPRGLEPILSQELSQLQATNPQPLKGGVQFSGPFDLCYRVNLESRIASRVLWKVHTAPYRTEHDIYDAARSLPWPDWFSVHQRIKVTVNATQCPLTSLDFVTLRIKDAVCDHFKQDSGARPSVDTRHPDIGIFAFLDRASVTLYLDTTGEPLFKRGLRKSKGSAPLRENVAAGILRLAGWTPGQVLFDPMCGSGTFLLEAAHIAGNIAPGLNRHFAFEHFQHFDGARWDGLCRDRRTQQRAIPPATLYGCDRDPQALKAAHTNVALAGLEPAITLEQADLLDVTPPQPQGIVVTNPPYGVRCEHDADLANWYPLVGDALKRRFVGWRVFLFTADRRLPQKIRLTAARRIPLFNGALECRLLEYPIVAGSHRTQRKSRAATSEHEKRHGEHL